VTQVKRFIINVQLAILVKCMVGDIRSITRLTVTFGVVKTPCVQTVAYVIVSMTLSEVPVLTSLSIISFLKQSVELSQYIY